jgi:hypothetical protein
MKTEELQNLIAKHSLFPQRFLLTEDGNFIYSESDKKLKKVSLVYRHFNILKSSKHFHNRGKLLEDIMVIEYLLSQIVFLKLSADEIVFFDYKKVVKWNKFLDKFTFDQKTKLIDSWGLIEKKDKKKIDNLRRFRNDLAHSFSGKYLEYLGEPIKDNFEIFEKDFYASLDALVKINNKLWTDKNIKNKTIEWIKKNYEKL